ncbi:MAG: hypothetical protein ACYDAL_15390 [Candidatus Dormibacteraceae bacterium]
MTDLQPIVGPLKGALGESLLAYMLGLQAPVQVEAWSAVNLTTQQRDVVGLLGQIAATGFVQAAPEESRNDLVRALVMQQSPDGTPLARILRAQAGATESPPAAGDPVEQAILRLAFDAYPAFLLPPKPQFRVASPINIEATALILRHPASRTFAEGVKADSTLGRAFVERDQVGLVTWVWRSTGSGGTIQLELLPELILHAAWRHVGGLAPSPGSFGAESRVQLNLVRNLLAGQPQNVTAKYAFTGILLPDGVSRVDLSGATLEAVTDADREIAPEVLKQQITHTGRTGEVTTANYDGDVVLRMSFPLRVRVEAPPDAGEVNAWPEDMHLPPSLDRCVERLRLSLLLAVRRDFAAQLLPTWRYFDDPFGHGLAASWFDPRNAAGFVPIRLSAEEVQSVREWYHTLSHPRLDKIGVALRRIIKAVAERREPADVLIDSVIAWENMFGTSEGEPTLRVTASLTILLEPNLDKREALRRDLNAIYKLRSKLVHGSYEFRPSDGPLCQAALDVALRALKVLAEKRVDVLEKADGAERSLYVMLRG